jgi:molybdopterin converting factor small subunit
VKVSVKLIATYRKLLPPDAVGNRFEVEISLGTTVGDLLSRYGVPLDATSVILVNGHTIASFDHMLADGDAVGAFSAMAGG